MQLMEETQQAIRASQKSIALSRSKRNLRIRERIRAGQLTIAQALDELERAELTHTETYRKLRRGSTA
jgi:hypothetical protein